MSIYLPETLIAQYAEQVVGVLKSGNIAEGPCRKAVEDKVSALFDDENMQSVLVNSNGTGIFALLHFFKKYHNATHVVAQTNTMYGIKTIINLAGLTPVILPSPNMVMDEVALAEYLESVEANNIEEENTKIVPVVLYSHIGGTVGFNIEQIAKTAEAYGAPLIEDCAHSLGAQDQLYGDVGVFSLYATKAVPAGEGGVVFTNQGAIYDFLTRFMMYDRIHMEFDIGVNIRVSEVQSLLSSLALDHLPAIVENRRATMLKYDAVCRELGIMTYYQGADLTDVKHNAYKYIITDPRVIDYFKNSSKVVTQGEYSGNDVLTGTVFGYSLDSNVQEAIPHICLNTNYGVAPELVEATINHLKNAVA